MTKGGFGIGLELAGDGGVGGGQLEDHAGGVGIEVTFADETEGEDIATEAGVFHLAQGGEKGFRQGHVGGEYGGKAGRGKGVVPRGGWVDRTLKNTESGP